MKRIIGGFILAACAFAMIGWGSAYEGKKNADSTHEQADKKRQGNDEDIKRAQGDGGGLRDVHAQGPLQNDDRGKW